MSRGNEQQQQPSRCLQEGTAEAIHCQFLSGIWLFESIRRASIAVFSLSVCSCQCLPFPVDRSDCLRRKRRNELSKMTLYFTTTLVLLPFTDDLCLTFTVHFTSLALYLLCSGWCTCTFVSLWKMNGPFRACLISAFLLFTLLSSSVDACVDTLAWCLVLLILLPEIGLTCW